MAAAAAANKAFRQTCLDMSAQRSSYHASLIIIIVIIIIIIIIIIQFIEKY